MEQQSDCTVVSVEARNFVTKAAHLGNVLIHPAVNFTEDIVGLRCIEAESQMKLNVNIEIPDQRIKDLLTNALEGGSNYWYLIEDYHYPPEVRRDEIEFPHIDLPFIGGHLIIGDREDEKNPKVKLDYKAMRKGLRIMAKEYPQHFADFLSENDDASTGDIFLQCALFGEIVYC